MPLQKLLIQSSGKGLFIYCVISEGGRGGLPDLLQYYMGGGIVAKKWEPGNLVPSRFSGKIRKVEARLRKLAKIRKVETN